MGKEQARSARARVIEQMQAGQPWKMAKASAGIPISRSTAYCLLQQVQKRGEMALQDGRHGHPVKLRGVARTFLEDYCQRAPCTPSSAIQTLLQELFGVNVSISQINRVRAALGISNHPESRLQEKNSKPERCSPATGMAGGGREPALIGCCRANRGASPSRVSAVVESPSFSSIIASCSRSTGDNALPVADPPLS